MRVPIRTTLWSCAQSRLLLDPGPAGARVVDIERHAPRISAPREPGDFTERVRHVFVPVQVLGAEVPQRVIDNDVRVAFGNCSRNALAVFTVEREEAVIVRFKCVKQNALDDRVAFLSSKSGEHSPQVRLQAAARVFRL